MSNLNVDNPAVSADETLPPELELMKLRAVSQMSVTLGTLLDVSSVTHEFVMLAQQQLGCDRSLLLLMNEEDAALEFGAGSSPLSDIEKQTMLEMLFVPTFNVMSNSPVSRLSKGELQVMTVETLAETRFEDILTLLSVSQVIACPLMIDARFIGVVIAYNDDNQDFTTEQQVVLQAICETAAISLYNARRHSETVQELATTLHEMNILHQIDEELNDTIELRYVFRTILDWALRFTNAEVANLCLYDVVDDTLTMMAHYGYLENIVDAGERMPDHLGGIIRRVARAGLPEVVPDVAYDKDYVAIHGQTRTQMSVPILREERVIAVLSLESNKLNGFTDGHLSFVEKLAQRAGVAVDNARLFTETRREREKLTLIVRNIADVVMVVGMDEHLILINQAALLALDLPFENRYIGHYFDEVIHDRGLQTFFRRARDNEDGASGEITLPNERTYHTSATLQKGTGWVIVLQDITHFKETDRLKTEL
ncbi:MAG: GAF domain-containing protein, partial [Aggregatilineales bacterium]